VVGYGLFGLAGAAAIVWPAPSVESATGWLVYVWAAWLAIGGTLAGAGAVTDRWLGEYAGLPLLSSAFGVYAVVIASNGRLSSAAGALALAAIAAVLFARWQDIGVLRKEATARARRLGGG
jgi:hypothetical protein